MLFSIFVLQCIFMIMENIMETVDIKIIKLIILLYADNIIVRYYILQFYLDTLKTQQKTQQQQNNKKTNPSKNQQVNNYCSRNLFETNIIYIYEIEIEINFKYFMFGVKQ